MKRQQMTRFPSVGDYFVSAGDSWNLVTGFFTVRDPDALRTNRIVIR